jgi:hypothetical protein
MPAQTPEKNQMEKTAFPAGWHDEIVVRVLEHYETQTEDEALAQGESAFEMDGQTMIEVPAELVPAVRELLAKHKAAFLMLKYVFGEG